MKSKILCTLGVFIPFSLIHFWHNDEDKFSAALILSVIFALIYLICFLIGIFKRKIYLILSFPIYIISFILLFIVINMQSRRNEANAEQLIKSIENYKIKEKSYPKTLLELQPKYQPAVPKVWFGVFSKEYGYSVNKKYGSYSLSIQVSNRPYKIWESSMGAWQFFD